MEFLRDLFTKQMPLEYPLMVFGCAMADAEALDATLASLFVWTYRADFTAPLPRSTLHTDKGWGCLIRTCQMMLSRVLQRHGEFQPTYFMDDAAAPFSIHRLVAAVANPKKAFEPKFWGPTQGCEAIRSTVLEAPLQRRIGVYTASRGSIYNDEVLFVLKQSPVLILMPVTTNARERITQVVFQLLEHLLASRHCVGVVGGVPKRSYYFVGSAGQRLLYLDPHVRTQPAYASNDTIGVTQETAATVSCVEWKRLDPSMLIGFYVKNVEEYAELTTHLLQWGDEDSFFQVEECRGGGRESKASVDDVETWD
jgi:hypothetical protein